MAKFRNQIKISAPVEKVWDVLSDVESVRHYNPLVKSVKRTSDNKEGVGTSRHCELKSNGFAKERVIVFEPKSKISFELVESSWPVKNMKWHTHLKSDGNSTVMSQDMEYDVKFGFLGKLLDSLIMKKKISQSIDDIFRSLKDYVEKK